MSEVVERVARAMFAAKPQRHTTWEQCDDGYRNTKRMEARAAIEATWPPTTAMFDAFIWMTLKSDTDLPPGAFEAFCVDYRAMIEAALK